MVRDRRLASLVGFAVLAPGLALAAPAKVDPAPAVQAVVQCRSIADGPQRLACFDAAAARLDDAQAKGDVIAIDRAQRRVLRKETFGFALPSLSIFDKGDPSDEANSLSLKVVSARQDAQGYWLIELEGGQVWRQIDHEPLARDPKAGSQAVIRKAALGSFAMKVDGQPSIKVHRDR